MLTEKTIQRLAALSKVKVEDLKAAITATDEKEVEIAEDLHVFTEPELTTLKANEYKNGKEKGPEMLIKEAKEKHGLDFQGKTIDGLMDAYGKKILADAKIEPEKKVQEMEEKLKTVQQTAQELQQKLADKDSEVQGVKIKSELYKHIPAFGENGPSLEPDDVLQMMTAKGFEFKLDNNVIVPHQDGKILTDKIGNPLKPADVITGFMKEKKLITEVQVPGGRGGNGGGGGIKYAKLSEIKEQFTKDGKSLMGEEFKQAVSQAVEAYKEFDMSA